MKRRVVRKAVVGTVGSATVATGVALLVLPGPGLVVIAGGLALLGKEFPAARKLLDRAQDEAKKRVRR